ncbi:MAG: histidine phosphatase family protein [Lachnospiraceae bacterium]|nr:histidine phosphatase family protein [Lachnospiraceae bacterium]
MRLIFVRHGEPDYVNDRLTENGVLQAKSTAVRLKDEDIREIYSSPMGRARETASFTAESHSLEIKVLDFMHEIDWGAKEDSGSGDFLYDGHPWTLGYRLLVEDPECMQGDAWEKHPYFRDNRCMEYYRHISEKLDGFLSGFGLIRKGMQYLVAEKRDDTIAMFAHGGSGAVLFSHILNLPFPYVLSAMPYGVCSVSIISFSDEMDGKVIPRLELFNDMGHLSSFRQEKLHFEK